MCVTDGLVARARDRLDGRGGCVVGSGTGPFVVPACAELDVCWVGPPARPIFVCPNQAGGVSGCADAADDRRTCGLRLNCTAVGPRGAAGCLLVWGCSLCVSRTESAKLCCVPWFGSRAAMGWTGGLTVQRCGLLRGVHGVGLGPRWCVRVGRAAGGSSYRPSGWPVSAVDRPAGRTTLTGWTGAGTAPPAGAPLDMGPSGGRTDRASTRGRRDVGAAPA